MIAAKLNSNVRKVLACAIGLWMLAVAPASAEPVLDRILSGAQVTDKGTCAVLRIDFNIRIRYISHFPGDKGNQLSIKIAAIDAVQARNELITRREAAPAPFSKIAGIRAIEFEADRGTEPALLVTFKQPMAFNVSAGKDFQSIIVAIAAPGNKPCAPVLASGSAGGTTWSTTVSPETLPPATTAAGEEPAKGKLNEKDRASVGALMDRARESLGAGASDGAIRYLTRVLGYPKSEVTQEATELLGVAYQRKGDLQQARAQYNTYLSGKPSPDDAKRVRDRLVSLDNTPVASSTGQARRRESRLGMEGQPAYVVTGSFSQYYLRDDGFHSFNDPSLPPQINQAPDEHNTFQNELLSSFDLTAQWGDSATQSKFRFSGASENGLTTGDRQIASIATAELDTTIKDWGVTTKLGRQSHNTGGVLGRFDGGVLSLEVLPNLRLDTVVGSPVLLRRDLPFQSNSFFYGEALNFGPLFGAFDTTIYAIEQRTAGMVDRQAVGSEIRYADVDKSAFASIDYDTKFNAISSAIVNGTWTAADKSTFTVSAEHRSSPALYASDALIGLPFTSLKDLIASGLYSTDEIYRLAKDRSAFADTATIGFSRPVNDHLQVSLDASWFSLSGTPASPGVDAVAASGNDYYVSGQLTGNDLFKPSDLYVFGLRYAMTPDTKTYVTDLSARYPVSDALRLNPRLRLSYATNDLTQSVEYSVLPSMRLDYQWTRNWNLELEGGAKLTRKLQGGTQDDQSELFITVGYRYDFDLEGAIVGATK